MNKLYFFILGKNYALSIAEILSQIDKSSVIEAWSPEFLIIKTKDKISELELQEKLGGTIKIGEIIKENVIFEKLNADFFVKQLPNIHKVYFGFSFYNFNHHKNTKKLALEIKKSLKEKNLSSRWVESKEKNLSSVIVQKNKLLTHGAEFIFLFNKNKLWLGKTISCQKFDDYSHRDYGRPARKIEEGMLPPKLAKIMINLAQVPEKLTILDPFCGSGTILQEAILIGYKNIIGTDISEEAIKSSQKNMEWLIKNYTLSTINYKLFRNDVRNLSQKISLNSIDAIITEPYLGPIKLPIHQSEILNLTSELSSLYLSTFKEFKKLLKPSGKITIIFPVFKANGQLNFISILDELKKSGWQTIQTLPKELNYSSNNRGSIVYSRPNQTVLREVFVFKNA